MASALPPDQAVQLRGVARVIDQWIASLTLTRAQGLSLLTPLQSAVSLLTAGNVADGNVLLGRVVRLTRGFVQSGVLTPAQGAVVVGPVSGVIAGDIFFT